MNWKSWPYWVKGGMVALVITIVMLSIALSRFTIYPPIAYPMNSLGMTFVGPALAPVFFVAERIEKNVLNCATGEGIFKITDLPSCDSSTKLLITWFAYLIVLMEYFVIGIFIGYLYGKIKNRKRISFL